LVAGALHAFECPDDRAGHHEAGHVVEAAFPLDLRDQVRRRFETAGQHGVLNRGGLGFFEG
jgi:hypothetical protein